MARVKATFFVMDDEGRSRSSVGRCVGEGLPTISAAVVSPPALDMHVPSRGLICGTSHLCIMRALARL